VPNAETEEKIRITSKMMGIGFKELLKRKPGVLSGGEQQRLAIGRAIVRTPRIFLFDVPCIFKFTAIPTVLARPR
jgi:multiple sugar transport system ATP-binding protein